MARRPIGNSFCHQFVRTNQSTPSFTSCTSSSSPFQKAAIISRAASRSRSSERAARRTKNKIPTPRNQKIHQIAQKDPRLIKIDDINVCVPQFNPSRVPTEYWNRATYTQNFTLLRCRSNLIDPAALNSFSSAKGNPPFVRRCGTAETRERANESGREGGRAESHNLAIMQELSGRKWRERGTGESKRWDPRPPCQECTKADRF